MTPERIEEKKRLHEHKHPDCAALVTVGEFNSLLAALEESQQQNKRLEVKLQASRDSVYPISVERDEYKVELAEAQQTIARQREVLEFLADDDNWSWCWVGTEDETVTWIGGTDPQDAARTALGNKEGSDPNE